MDNGSGQDQLTREQQNVADMVAEARRMSRDGADPEMWKLWTFQCNIRSISNTKAVFECAVLLNAAEDCLRGITPHCSNLFIPTEPTQ